METAKDIAKILITEHQIRKRVFDLAGRISADYRGKKLTVVPVLKGSVIFFADLIRMLKVNCSVDFIAVSSYKGTASSGRVKMLMDLRESPENKNILLIEDVVDSGYTLNYIQKNIVSRKAASLKTCVLLDKPHLRKVRVKVDYRGFVIPDKFVIGYGLDFNESYRNLPYIGVLKKEAGLKCR